MERSPEIPLWVDPRPLFDISGLREAEGLALEPRPGEPVPKVNHHQVFLGPRALLARKAGYILDRATRVFQLDRTTNWHFRRPLFEAAFESFFGNDDLPGWVTLLNCRRQFRDRPDVPAVTAVQEPCIFTPLGRAKAFRRRPLRLPFGVILPSEGLAFARKTGSSLKKCELMSVEVPRWVHTPRPLHTLEYRLCLGRSGEDDWLLRTGLIPALNPEGHSPYGIGANPLLLLRKLSPGGTLTTVGFEVALTTGLVASVRAFQVPLETMLRGAVPVEHRRLMEGIKGKSL